MPLTFSNWEQNSGYLFEIRRLSDSVSTYDVRMRNDDRKARAAVLASIMVVVILSVAYLVVRIVKPMGTIDGNSPFVADRDTGDNYVLINGVLYPTWNLVSGRLITGNSGLPKKVSSSEIAKYTPGGIAGIPDAPKGPMVFNTPEVAAFSACDTAASTRAGGNQLKMTVIAGELTLGDRADVLKNNQAVLVSFGGATYAVWDGQRSRIDLADRAVSVNLGLDPGVVAPVQISKALFDALPATEPIVVPVVPGGGTPAPWPTLGGLPVGAVVEVREAGSSKGRFYVVLTAGLQPVTEFTANLLRTANSYGDASVRVLSPDKTNSIPQVDVLNVGFYPTARMQWVDTAVNPVTCVSWQKARGDRQASVQVVSGRGLPIPVGVQPAQLTRDDRDPNSVEANEAVVLPGAANFVSVTSGVSTSDTKEGLWWIGPQGMRYGLGTDSDSLMAFGFGQGVGDQGCDSKCQAFRAASQAPDAIVRMFGTGPLLTKERALIVRDTVSGVGQSKPLFIKPSA